MLDEQAEFKDAVQRRVHQAAMAVDNYLAKDGERQGLSGELLEQNNRRRDTLLTVLHSTAEARVRIERDPFLTDVGRAAALGKLDRQKLVDLENAAKAIADAEEEARAWSSQIGAG